ncbi:MAG: hypothetical protein Q8Q52_07555 [Acidimicrobiia bacterium]|nr:hypothetical protein [Acidimicrobiia bacterium]
MARLFLRLKIRLTRNRLRKAGAWAAVAFIGLWLLATLAGSIFGLLAGVVTRVAGGPGTAALFTLAGIAWLVGPVVAAALDETIEPRRLELLPISPTTMTWGLLAASVVGPGAFATALFTSGALIGAAPALTTFIPSLVAGVVFLLWCLVSARFATTLLSDLLRTRRAREVAVLAAAVLGGGSVFASTFLTGDRGDPLAALAESGRIATWFPPGALGRAIILLADGEWGLGLGLVAYGVGATSLAMLGWRWSLARLTSRAPGGVSAGKALSAEFPLMPRLLQGLGGRPVLATVGKELRYLRRDPRFRSQAIGLGVALAALGFGVGRFLLGTEYAPFLAVVVAWMAASSTGFNQFGFDDRSFWAYLVSGVDMRRVLRGKNLAIAMVGLPVLVMLALGAAVLTGDFRHLLSAILTGGAVLAVWLAVGNVVSILGAYPLPESNLFGNKNVSGSVMLASLGGLAAAGVLTAPIAAMVALPLVLGGAWQGLIGSVVAAVLGLLLYRLSVSVAGGLLDSRSLRLLEILDKPQV